MERAEEALAPEVREQLLDTLDEMAEVLRSINGLAEHRGFIADWWSLVRRMIALRGRLEFGPLGQNFAEALEDLCLQYDLFVETVLPNPQEH